MNEKQNQDFLEEFGSEKFNHSEELFQGLEDGSWNLTSYTGGEKNRMQAKMFVEIYGKKAKQLNKDDDDYAKVLQNELIDFCKAMEKLGEEIIDVWSFSNESFFISVFVVRQNGKIVATLKTKS